MHNYEKIRGEMVSGNTGKREMKRLMKATYHMRRKWILEKSPQVVEVLEKFPRLMEEKFVSQYTLELNMNRMHGL